MDNKGLATGIAASLFLMAGLGSYLWYRQGDLKLELTGISLGPVGSLDSHPVHRYEKIPELEAKLAIYPTVFWEPLDTLSLRERLRETPVVHGKTVLEIGTGSGLIALCCAQAGARHLVATDVNPAAIACARANAARMGFSEIIEFRQVPAENRSAFAVVAPTERFDLIVSNPPWEDGSPDRIDQFALYDPGFELLKSLLHGARDHLKPGGKIWLAYGCKQAILRLNEFVRELKGEVKVLDERNLSELPEVFLPGMLLEVTFPAT